MNYENIIAQEKKSFEAKARVEAEVKKNKDEILAEFKNDIFDFLELIQMDKSIKFKNTCTGNADDLVSSFSGDKDPKKAIDWNRKHSLEGNWLLLTTINHYVKFKISEDFVPSVIFEAIVPYGKNIETSFTDKEAFAIAFTKVCLRLCIK